MEFKVPLFDVAHLSLQKRKQTILDNVTLQIFAGEYVAIIGPNGGGKSTFVRLLLGLEKPTSGMIKLFGKDIAEFGAWKKIGYVPQRATLVDKNFPATALEIVRMGQVADGGFFALFSQSDTVRDAMEKMDVWSLRNRLIGELSGGERQRVMIARALASYPQILILDEPNTGVDTFSQRRFYELLRKLNEEGITIIFITHDIGVIADDISKLITINQRATVCLDPQNMLSCDDVSRLYGIEAHHLAAHKKRKSVC